MKAVKKALRALGWRTESASASWKLPWRHDLRHWVDDKAAVRCDRVRVAVLELASAARGRGPAETLRAAEVWATRKPGRRHGLV